jgi:hypothetical protein
MTDRSRWLAACIASTTALISLVLGSAFSARWLLVRFAVSSAWREHAILWGLSLVAVLGGFYLFADATWAWTYWRRGWRVRWIAADRYAYEELDDDGGFRSLEIRYEPLEARYAPPCRITVPGADEWTAMTQTWAHGRRDAILERIRRWGGGEGWNASVTFVPAAAAADAERDRP